MNKKFTLSILLLLAGFLPVLAAGPTVPASNPRFTLLEGNRVTFTFNRGDGDARITVMREAAKVAASPANGTDYTANNTFETLAAAFGNTSNGYVVNKTVGRSSGTASFVTLNLKPATKYYISVFEYNGSGSGTEYLTLALVDSITTQSAPTGLAANITFSETTGNSVKIKWDKGTGERRVVLARKGGPVNAIPVDLIDYGSSSFFGSGDDINGDNYVVFKGTEAMTTITNLEPNTSYHFAVFEFNGNSGPVFMKTAVTASTTTSAGPTVPSDNPTFSFVDGNSLTMSLNKGNGKYQLIIARKGQPVTAVPVNGRTYTPDTRFQFGEAIEPGQYVMNTTGSNRIFNNLEASTVYYFRVYDYDVTNSGYTYYLTGIYGEGPKSTSTTPTEQAKQVTFDNITGTTATLRFTAGVGGSGRLVLLREGSAVDANPADLTKYQGSTNFSAAAEITPGNRIIGTFTGTSASITGLTPGKTYYAAVFEYSGSNAPMYARPGATATTTLPNEPTVKATNFSTGNVEGTSFQFTWSGGNGSHRLVIARKGAAVSARPVDGTMYNANNRLGDGTLIGTDEFVVYDGEDRTFNLQKLEAASTYHLAVFEYNNTATGPDYLISSFLAGSASTVSAPTQQATVTSGNIQNTQATISYARGNGSSRIFIMRAGSPVDVAPQDLAYYNNSSTIFGTYEIGTGNYIVYKTGGTSTFTVTNLQPNTQYHIAVFEFNGNTVPVYMRPGNTQTFTTTNNGVLPPTSASHNARFSAVEGNKFTLNIDAGDGANRVVVMRAGNAVSFAPVDGNGYPEGTNLGSGQSVVYNGGNSGFTITNLQPNTTYHFAIYEYNGSGASSRYLQTSFTAQGASASTPTGGVSNVIATAANTTATISWTSGPGKGRLVVVKEGSNVLATPANLTTYTPSTTFRSGVQIAADEYVVYANTTNSVTVTNLNPAKIYYYSIFEYNGEDAPVYNTANKMTGRFSATAILPLRWLYFTGQQQDGVVKLDWGTAEEQQVRYFVVERSNGANGFVSIDTVLAKGGPGNNYYSYRDAAPLSGKVNYRLKQVDADGDPVYSKQVMLDVAGSAGKLKVYPNPASGQFRISLPAGLTQAKVELYDAKGLLVKTTQVSDKQAISLAGVVPGLYHVVVRSETSTYTEQVIVR